MKKTMSAITAIAIIASMVSALPTFAVEKSLVKGNQTGTVQFKYDVPESYTVTIPDDVSSLTEASELKVTAKDVLINTGKVLDVSISSKSEWKLVNEENAEVTIGYELYNGANEETALKNTDKVLSIESGNKAGDTTTIKVKSIAEAFVAGTYNDTLTFTVAVNNQETAEAPEGTTTTASSSETTPETTTDTPTTPAGEE